MLDRFDHVPQPPSPRAVSMGEGTSGAVALHGRSWGNATLNEAKVGAVTERNLTNNQPMVRSGRLVATFDLSQPEYMPERSVHSVAEEKITVPIISPSLDAPEITLQQPRRSDFCSSPTLEVAKAPTTFWRPSRTLKEARRRMR